uniref:PAS domain-containing hybrid sensor histidine kinase/response regulator n=1 Tax=Algoriphagus sp. TaxID=1872435 RepID=UPI0025903F70|nr:PAS domain-containing hybrid sensor histidine kinase/response regulator [Algoriphagus sp.]
MIRKFFDSSNFGLTTIVGAVMIILVISIGVSFFNAIYNSQLESRKEFLNKQTELASRGIEFELNRFKEESRTFLAYLETAELDEKKVENDLTIATRRTFTAFPRLVDSLWVDLKDSVLVYTLTSRNDFIRRSVKEFPQKSSGEQLLVEGKSGYRVLYSFDFLQFAKEYSANFYQTPGGSKYLFWNSTLWDIGASSSEKIKTISGPQTDPIWRDIQVGLKGFYPVSWTDDSRKVEGILAQYPFTYIDNGTFASLVFTAPVESLTSGIYSTYFYLFIAMVFLLIGTIGFFIISIKSNLEVSRTKEENLREVSELFDQQNLLLKELRGFVFFHDYRGMIQRVSDEVEEVLGHPKESYLEAFKEGGKHPVANAVKEEIKLAIQENREFVDMEYDVIKSNGEKIRVRIFEKLIYDESGRFNGGMGICTDISEQYKSRIAIIESENRLRTLINNLPDVIFIYDNEGKVLDFQIQGRENLLEPAKFTLGKKLEDFVPHDQGTEVKAAFLRARNTGKIQAVDAVWKDGPEGLRHYEIRFFPLDQHQMISISKDITSQKIWEKGLVEAMNSADQASRAKSEFLANMSHEIRTPMNGLLGIIDLLESTNLNKIQKQYVDIIKNSGNSLLSIIKDILDYSKIESGRIEIQYEVFNPVEEVRDQVKILLGIAKKKGIKLDLSFGMESEILVEGDKGKINQVLLNLIGNALKFTSEKGRVHVSLKTESVDQNLFSLLYRIEDNGIGISEEHIKQLSDPFFQVESSSTRSYQGTGLGLAIAKKLIELLGGEMTVQSQPGKGSVFSFSVLVKKADGNSPKNKIQELTWKDIKEMGTEFPLRILLAEDNELNLQLMTLMFQQLGFEFEIARNGKEAYDKVQAKKFDVVLMDVQMPIMNGLEATIEIRKLPNQEDLVIIGLSANVFEEDQKKALEIGMDDYLTKPIRLTVLADKLESYFRKVRGKESD